MLTYDENINVEIDKIGDDDLGKPIYLDIPLSRKEFEEIISPFIKKSLSLVRETIKESGIQKYVIEKIVLV
jgi:molecular chaperone DnaK (HSP70)